MSEDKIRVVLLEPNRMAKAAEIASSLEAMQRVVQGDIQAIYPFEEEVCIVCNEEGKIDGLPLNRALIDENHEIYDIIASKRTCKSFPALCGGITPQNWQARIHGNDRAYTDRFESG